VCEDINRLNAFRTHLLAIARIERPGGTDSGESWIGDYELEIRAPGKEQEIQSSRCAGGRNDDFSDWFMWYLISLESVVIGSQ
jgi:hypothetical protein